MKLITEVNIDSEIKYLEEEENGKKNYYIEGKFMGYDEPNKNGRMYPKGIMEKEVGRYQELINEKRSLGELGHPPTPTVNLDKVSHLISELRMNHDGGVYGKAKILSTPMGKIAENFIKEGVRLGVSSRGVGSLKEKDGINEVQDDFQLATVDIVSDPSAPGAFVNGIMENAEWIMTNGAWSQQTIENAQKTIRKASKRQLSEAKLQVFKKLLNSIK
tara:strand:- start:122 stop:772 length:651 start_codon:yes stop_codon:yes gene_type:complete